MFLKVLDTILIVAMIGAAALTYRIKAEAGDKLEEIHRLEAAIRGQEATIDLLKADWSLLNQPSRLERLVSEYKDQLHLETIEATQMAKPSELPGFPLDADTLISGKPGQPDAGLKTGSVRAQ